MSVQYVLDKVVLASGISEGIYSLKEVLNSNFPEFSHLKEIALKLKKDGYVHNLECCEKESDIRFELTEKGMRYLEWYRKR